MSAVIVSQLRDIIDQLVDDKQYVCAAHVQMAVDKLATRSGSSEV